MLKRAAVVLALLAISTTARAQDGSKIGLTFGYPVAVGMLWNAADRIALRPEFTWSKMSTDAPAIAGPNGEMLTYSELDGLADRIGRALEKAGVVAGDRVGLWLEKSPDVVAAMRDHSPAPLGALYVDGGPSRNLFLMQSVANVLGHQLVQRDAPETSALKMVSW